jgi:HSP20 family molecular chaperone IbpA
MELLDHGLYQIYRNLGVSIESYDVQETDDKIIITFGVPGLVKKDIDVTIRGGTKLRIKSMRSTKFTPDFLYVFAIPCSILKEETYAVVQDGILTVYIQKAESLEFKVKLN